MKLKKISIALSLCALLFAVSARAEESLVDIAQNKAIKAAVIQHMQDLLAKHEAMTQPEIVQDLEVQLSSQAQSLLQKGIVVDFSQTLSKLESFDKDTLLAMERLKLQSMMRSTNYIFVATSALLDVVKMSLSESAGTSDPFPGSFYGSIVWLPVTFVLDLILLPVEIVLTMITGV